MFVEGNFWVTIGWKKKRVTERKKEVKGVKGARKDTKIGRIRREERQREQEKALIKKANIHRRRATLEGNTKSSRKQTKKRSSTKINELQRIRERRRGKLSLMLGFFFFTLRPGKIQTFFTNCWLILVLVYNSNHVSVKFWHSTL